MLSRLQWVEVGERVGGCRGEFAEQFDLPAEQSFKIDGTTAKKIEDARKHLVVIVGSVLEC